MIDTGRLPIRAQLLQQFCLLMGDLHNERNLVWAEAIEAFGVFLHLQKSENVNTMAIHAKYQTPSVAIEEQIE